MPLIFSDLILSWVSAVRAFANTVKRGNMLCTILTLFSCTSAKSLLSSRSAVNGTGNTAFAMVICWLRPIVMRSIFTCGKGKTTKRKSAMLTGSCKRSANRVSARTRNPVSGMTCSAAMPPPMINTSAPSTRRPHGARRRDVTFLPSATFSCSCSLSVALISARCWASWRERRSAENSACSRALSSASTLAAISVSAFCRARCSCMTRATASCLARSSAAARACFSIIARCSACTRAIISDCTLVTACSWARRATSSRRWASATDFAASIFFLSLAARMMVSAAALALMAACARRSASSRARRSASSLSAISVCDRRSAASRALRSTSTRASASSRALRSVWMRCSTSRRAADSTVTRASAASRALRSMSVCAWASACRELAASS